MGAGAEIRSGGAAQRVGQGYGFIEDHVLGLRGETLLALGGAGVSDVGFVDPNPVAERGRRRMVSRTGCETWRPMGLLKLTKTTRLW
jgi:hypothetical protein